MRLFESASEASVFEDAAWLQPLSSPPGGRPLCRDGDLGAMAACLSQALKVGQGRNIVICGKPGTGKTVCAKFLLDEVRRHADENIVPLASAYVNAGQTGSPYYTLLEIVEGLEVSVPESGWQMFRLKQALGNITKEKAVVIGIDEVDSLLLDEREPLVYYLNRQPRTTLILILNKVEEAAALSSRALSTLQPEFFLLRPYTPEEAEAILKDRAEKAFRPNTLSPGLLKVVARAASEAQDLRFGLSVLLSAGLLAEEEGRTKIVAEDVSQAIHGKTVLGRLRELRALKKRVEATREGRDSQFN